MLEQKMYCFASVRTIEIEWDRTHIPIHINIVGWSLFLCAGFANHGLPEERLCTNDQTSSGEVLSMEIYNK